jgi:hypothetical protein
MDVGFGVWLKRTGDMALGGEEQVLTSRKYDAKVPPAQHPSCPGAEPQHLLHRGAAAG